MERMAARYSLRFARKMGYRGRVTEGLIQNSRVVGLMPSTFMNLSGLSVAALVRQRPAPLSHLLVIIDDVNLPFGEIRLKGFGSSGGHHGLESIEEYLQTTQFPRFRIGIGRGEGALADYVLGEFSSKEMEMLPKILDKVIQAIEIWLEKGLLSAMDFANRRDDSLSSPS
jgi:PTH1 family peptidyl-tRNA hydrolase